MAYPIQQGLFKHDIVDYHTILGVPLGINPEKVRDRFLQVAYLLHPDTCQAGTEIAKEQASQFFSKWVNPAYEHLAKTRLHSDYLLVLSKMGKTLSQNTGDLELQSEVAKKLFQEKGDIELIYRKIVNSLLSAQYADLANVWPKIGQMSELNCVYLLRTEGRSLKPKTQVISSTTTQTAASSEKTKSKEKVDVSPLTRYLHRAQENLAKNNLGQALHELRDAIKLAPNDSTCHSLLGLTYLKQNQISMAKIHINKAFQLNPQDPSVILAKKELDKVLPDKGTDKSTGLFGGIFGGKKGK